MDYNADIFLNKINGRTVVYRLLYVVICTQNSNNKVLDPKD
jgi:hypothetical protein